MKTLFLVLLSASFSIINGQFLKNLKVFCSEKFDSRASITIHALEEDRCSAVSFLTNNLVMLGFKVVSESVAKEKVETSNKIQTTDSTLVQEISSGKTKYLNSVYLIALSYRPRSEVSCSGIVMKDMTGQVIDLANDGEIVATFSFKQNMMEAKCTSKVMEELAKALKNKKK